MTLAEALISLLVVLLVLGTIGQLMAMYSQTLRFSSGKDRSVQAIEVGLDRAAGELRQASLVSTPPIGSSVAYSELILQRFNPNESSWLPTPVPTPPLPAWKTMYIPTVLLEVRYAVVSGNLVREVGPVAATPTSTQLVAEGVDGFAAERLANGEIELRISLLEEARARTFRTRVLCPAAP